MKTLQLVGCGILKKEVTYLIEKNNWSINTDFLPPSLHINCQKLACALQDGLARHTNEPTMVFYGACHPQMDKMLANAQTLRTEGQNCIAMLLGEDEFMRELSAGAFFLLDNWAQHWDEVIAQTFGTNLDLIRDIFHEQHRYFLALQTPFSDDYSKEAAHISAMLNLPLRWRFVTLEHLERVLQTTIERKLASMS